MWYDNKSCYYSLIRENADQDMYCFYEFVKTGVIGTPVKCCEQNCPIVQIEKEKIRRNSK